MFWCGVKQNGGGERENNGPLSPKIRKVQTLEKTAASPYTSKDFYYTPKNFKISIISSLPFTVER